MTQLLLAYYGDDFTGSADVMEVLQWSGLRTILFLDPPTGAQLDQFADLKAFGVAGWSRTMSPEEMETELQPIFNRLRESGARIVHYKTCSTFDSSPQIGSIGKAIELGRATFGESIVPILIGAPSLGRYQVFGNLFARSGLDSDLYRLDRHPTMKKHPITPMMESDIRELLALQTRLQIDLYDILRLNAADFPANFAALQASGGAGLLFDVLYPEHMARIGCMLSALIDRNSPKFVVGSSGIEYALTAYWAAKQLLSEIPSQPACRPSFGATDQILTITGSCSPVNQRQIAWAEQNGFRSLAIDTARLVNEVSTEQVVSSTVQQALSILVGGNSLILHSSLGPSDPRVSQTNQAFLSMGFGELDIKLQSGRLLGPKLGRILREILDEHPVARVGVAGGDTSGYIARELGIKALEAIAPVAPGSPLCSAYADNALNRVEFFFKGGQVGRDDVWGTILNGTNRENAAW